MLVMVFVAISISDYRVTNCLSPREGEFPFDCRDCLQRFGSHLPYFQTWDWLDVVNYVKHVTCRCVVFLFVFLVSDLSVVEFSQSNGWFCSV